MGLAVHHGIRSRRVLDRRPIKQAELKFHTEHIHDPVIDHLFGQLPLFDQCTDRENEFLGRIKLRTDIAARLQILTTGLLVVRSHVMLASQILDGITVRNNIPAEAKSFPENGGQELLASGNWNAVKIIIGTHHPVHSRLADDPFPGPKVKCLHFTGSHMGVCSGFPVPPTLGNRINGKMLAR